MCIHAYVYTQKYIHAFTHAHAHTQTHKHSLRALTCSTYHKNNGINGSIFEISCEASTSALYHHLALSLRQLEILESQKVTTFKDSAAPRE